MNDELVVSALQDLVAIERDRQLGYQSDELHMNPRDALVDGMRALAELGVDPNDVVWEDDQRALGIDMEVVQDGA